MIRDSRPQEGEPYDMDIDLPIPTDGDTAGIVTPEEWSAAPPELAKAEKQAESAGAPELAVPQSAVLQKPYQIPPMDFLQPGISRANDPAAEQELKEKAGILVDTLNSFGVTVRITGISRGRLSHAMKFSPPPVSRFRRSPVWRMTSPSRWQRRVSVSKRQFPASLPSASKSPTATRTPSPCGKFWRATTSAMPAASSPLPWAEISPETVLLATSHGCLT